MAGRSDRQQRGQFVGLEVCRQTLHDGYTLHGTVKISLLDSLWVLGGLTALAHMGLSYPRGHDIARTSLSEMRLSLASPYAGPPEGLSQLQIPQVGPATPGDRYSG